MTEKRRFTTSQKDHILADPLREAPCAAEGLQSRLRLCRHRRQAAHRAPSLRPSHQATYSTAQQLSEGVPS